MIRQFVLEFISPLALNHGQHLLAAAAHVWNERRHKSPSGNAKSVSALSVLAAGYMLHVKMMCKTFIGLVIERQRVWSTAGAVPRSTQPSITLW